jgi:hypothetical protein
MTRKTVPYKGTKDVYYFCPTGRKNGCDNPVMLKENELADCILDSVKAHISNVASLETLIAGLDATRLARELSEQLTAQRAENERRLEQIREFKARLYENMITGNLKKEEYQSLKGKYIVDADTLTAANARLQKEIDAVLSCRHERLMWMEHFKNFASLTVLDRKTVIHLIQSIRVTGKNELNITFNYQSEYESAFALLRKEAA